MLGAPLGLVEYPAIGGATVECTQNAPREIVTSVSTTRGDGRVFAKLHKIPSQIDVVSELCH